MTDFHSSRSEADTIRIARELGATLAAGDVVLLYGELGAGKTAFVRGLAEGLGADPAEVTSPTFTLLQEYRGGRVPVYHADLYRLEPKEVGELGLDELAADGVLAIEWADRLPPGLTSGPVGPPGIVVRITAGTEDERTVTVSRPLLHSTR